MEIICHLVHKQLRYTQLSLSGPYDKVLKVYIGLHDCLRE